MYQVSRLAVGLFAAKLVGPSQFGLWTLLTLLLTYGPLVHLGAINAMNRDVPLFKGRGETERADKVRAVTLGFMIVTTGATCLVLAVASFLIVHSSAARLAVWAMIGLFLGVQAYTYVQIRLFSDRQFRVVSEQQALFGIVLLPVFAIPLTVMWGLAGFILGQALAFALGAVLMAKRGRVAFEVSFDLDEVRRLVRVGFPILAVGLLQGLLTTVDRWVVTGYLGVTKLGYYGLAILVMGGVSLLPATVGQQVYPRMAESFGRTSNYSELRELIIRQTLLAVAFTVPVAVTAYVLLPSVVRAWLPAYSPGIPAARIALLGALFLPVAGAFGNFLNTVDKQVYYLSVQASAIPLAIVLMTLALQFKLELTSVAWAMSLTYAVYTLALAAVGRRVLRDGGQRLE